MTAAEKPVPVVLLCGLLCDQTLWSSVPRLLERHTDVVVISFAGFTSIEDMAAHVRAVAPPRFALAGHSMGGRVALEVFRTSPDRVDRLALLNTGVHPRRDGEVENRGRLVQLARDKGMTALAGEWLPPMMGDDPARTAKVMPDLIAMVERASPEIFAGQIKALLDRPDAAAVLPTVNVPTLLLSGTADRWSPLSQHEEMWRIVTHAELVAVERAGHMAPAERPEAVADALQHWLTAEMP